jgi:hypothetical protein
MGGRKYLGFLPAFLGHKKNTPHFENMAYFYALKTRGGGSRVFLWHKKYAFFLLAI